LSGNDALVPKSFNVFHVSFIIAFIIKKNAQIHKGNFIEDCGN